MNRRSFMGTIPLSLAALNFSPTARAEANPASEQTRWPVVPDSVSYFTRRKMESLVDTSVSFEAVPFEVVAYNYPAWHPTPFMEKIFGKWWTNFEVVRHAKPWFHGELQPKEPLWGMYDHSVPSSFNEADPAWAAKEIELASGSGIDVFMVDWYWFMGTQRYQEQLEQGFLRAPNRERMKFAIMWANLTLPNLFPAPLCGKPAILISQTYSESDMDRITDYLLEHYLHEPNYWRINDQPVFAIFNIDGDASILKHFGVEKLRKVFDRMRSRVAKAGLKGLHIQASQAYKAGVTPLKEAGFDSATNYHTFSGGPPGETTEYAQALTKSIDQWKARAARLDIPYFPDCPVGWDNSPRLGYNAHRVAGRTPDQYELQLLAAKYFGAAQRTKPHIVFLSSWNEWTEDHYLLPDSVHGYGFLNAVRRQFGPEEHNED